MTNLCYVVGKGAISSEVTRLLHSSNVPTLRFVYDDKDRVKFERSCNVNPVLRAIVVFGDDFKDGGVAIVHAAANVPDGTPPPALIVRDASRYVGNADPHMGVPGGTEFFVADTYDAFTIAMHIKRSYFSDRAVESSGRKKEKVIPATSTSAPTRIGAHIRETRTRQAPPQGRRNRVNVADVAQIGSVVRQAMLPVLQNPDSQQADLSGKQSDTTIQVPCVIQADLQDNSRFAELLRTMRRNEPLPADPFVCNIQGKDQKIVTLDPRRIKPLPDNPRWKDNPGFTRVSLEDLGKSIKLTGQLEDVLVCPIDDDPKYDAQLIDGERRLRACILAGVMIFAAVREDISQVEMTSQRYLLSVIRNHDKAPMTLRETIAAVKRFRSEEFGMSRQQVADVFGGKSLQWVMLLEQLAELHPSVLAMLADIPDEETVTEEGELPKVNKKTKRRGARILTQQHGQLLFHFPKDEQLDLANEIIKKGMSFQESRRFLIQKRTSAGIGYPGGRDRRLDFFRRLGTLSGHSVQSFGIFVDMPDQELTAVFANRSELDRSNIVDSLHTLQQYIQTILDRPELKL